MICSSTSELTLIRMRGRPALGGVPGLAPDLLDQAGADAVRGHHQRAVVGLPGVAGERVEQVGEVGADPRVGGEDARGPRRCRAVFGL